MRKQHGLKTPEGRLANMLDFYAEDRQRAEQAHLWFEVRYWAALPEEHHGTPSHWAPVCYAGSLSMAGIVADALWRSRDWYGEVLRWLAILINLGTGLVSIALLYFIVREYFFSRPEEEIEERIENLQAESLRGIQILKEKTESNHGELIRIERGMDSSNSLLQRIESSLIHLEIQKTLRKSFASLIDNIEKSNRCIDIIGWNTALSRLDSDWGREYMKKFNTHLKDRNRSRGG